jgi:hypothetical protein
VRYGVKEMFVADMESKQSNCKPIPSHGQGGRTPVIDVWGTKCRFKKVYMRQG